MSTMKTRSSSAMSKADAAQQESVTMENFELMRMLGKGAYGKVFLVRKVGGRDHGTIYAMKVLRKTRVMQKAKTLEHTIGERKVLETIKNSPFLVNMRYAFQSDAKLHLIMDYIRGGEMFTHLCARGHFELPTTQFYIAELTVALDHLHQLGIFYRDLKLENVMMDEHGHVMLTDFGLSKEFEDDEPHRANSYCGTIEYMAPEVVHRTQAGYDQCVDWWSLGVLTFELLTGCSPFTVEGAQNNSREIAERILTKRIPFPKTMDPSARDLIERLCAKKANARLGANGVHEIKAHKFFKGINWELLEKRQLPPPIKPRFAHPLDVANFSDEFTKQQPLYSPADSPTDAAKQLFRGYSFVSPSVLLSNNNVISKEYLTSISKPAATQWDIQKFGEDQKSPFFTQYTMDLSEQGYLGHGTFSVCRICRKKDTGAQFAVKVVAQCFAQQAIREAQILQQCSEHPNIVKFHEMLSDKFHFYLVMELLKGPELLTRIRQAKHFTEAEAARIFRKIVGAVCYIHGKGAVHRDLKPENILFDSESPTADLRLIDFGFARYLQATGGTGTQQPLSTPCFTLHYVAPEIIPEESKNSDWLPQYNQQCDLWSLGVILYTMLSGHVPFHTKSKNESANQIMQRIRSADFSFDNQEWHGVSQEAKDLIRGLLTVDPKQRLTADEVADHVWMRRGHSPETPLATPTVLSSSAAITFNETLNAFLTANKEGFRLADVDAAPLAQRRRRKQQSDEAMSSDSTPAAMKSTDSTSSSGGSTNAPGRKRKLFPVPEEAASQSGSVDANNANAKRPETLDIPQSPDFTTYRNPLSGTIRETRESKEPSN